MKVVEYTLPGWTKPVRHMVRRVGCNCRGESRRGYRTPGRWQRLDVKGVGAGVLEQKIDFGPGYRIYFGGDGDRLIILVGGGTKRRQDRDIADAVERWRDYKTRKTGD